jgi:hypothetical protein
MPVVDDEVWVNCIDDEGALIAMTRMASESCEMNA